ncbi:MAG TPA: tetratricopeptide repeat protein [Deltaproteobacteria bacterium]|jgi:tetratricopeptide (TPR) repeat protein|nr:tetratricopeptide repeat protein [Deltaproteobacteria bacterium]
MVQTKEFEERDFQDTETDSDIGESPRSRKGKRKEHASPAADATEPSPMFYLHSLLLVGGRVLSRLLDFYNSFFDLTHRDRAKIYRNISVHYMKKGQTEKAIEHLKEWARLEPVNPEAQYQLAIALVGAENYKSALGVINKVLKLDPGHKGAIYRKGTIYLKLKAYQEAIEAFEQFLNLHPENAKAHYFLGIAYAHTEQLDKAIETLKKAVELDPPEIKYYQHLGFLYERKGDHKEAASCFAKVMELEQAEEDE